VNRPEETKLVSVYIEPTPDREQYVYYLVNTSQKHVLKITYLRVQGPDSTERELTLNPTKREEVLRIPRSQYGSKQIGILAVVIDP
jgi:hypothetical protein